MTNPPIKEEKDTYHRIIRESVNNYNFTTLDCLIRVGSHLQLCETITIYRHHLLSKWVILRSLMCILTIYSLCFKIKVKFGHKFRYEIKVMFGEISLKLRQTNWNVARNNVNVVVDELSTQITTYTCLIFGLDGLDGHQRGHMCFSAIRPKWRASNKIGAKSFWLYYGHP